MKILFLSHHWTNNSHHSEHSGFQRIVAFAATLHEVTLVTWDREDSEYQDGPVRVVTIKASRRDFFFSKRLSISRKGRNMAGQFDVVHALYSDCTFSLSPGSYTVTFHVLPGAVRYTSIKQKIFLLLKFYVIQKKALRRAKHIAVVSRNLLSAIPEKFRGKAHFIPHGVDTGFWDPALASPPTCIPFRDYFLCVGAHGLDRQTIGNFIRANPTRQFVLVGIKHKLENVDNVHYLYDLSDDELRNIYAGATLMIRPLLFATANNSILEALSMGKTILVNRIDGVKDYLSDETCLFTDQLKSMTLAEGKDFCLDPVPLRQAAIDTFGWENIFASYLSLYH